MRRRYAQHRIPECTQHQRQRGEWETDDVRIVAADTLDEDGAVTLYGVRSGLVHRLARGDVGPDLPLLQRSEMYVSVRGEGADVRRAAGHDDRDPGHDLVDAAGQLAEHPGGVPCVCGFPE